MIKKILSAGLAGTCALALSACPSATTAGSNSGSNGQGTAMTCYSADMLPAARSQMTHSQFVAALNQLPSQNGVIEWGGIRYDRSVLIALTHEEVLARGSDLPIMDGNDIVSPVFAPELNAQRLWNAIKFNSILAGLDMGHARATMLSSILGQGDACSGPGGNNPGGNNPGGNNPGGNNPVVNNPGGNNGNASATTSGSNGQGATMACAPADSVPAAGSEMTHDQFVAALNQLPSNNGVITWGGLSYDRSILITAAPPASYDDLTAAREYVINNPPPVASSTPEYRARHAVAALRYNAMTDYHGTWNGHLAGLVRSILVQGPICSNPGGNNPGGNNPGGNSGNGSATTGSWTTGDLIDEQVQQQVDEAIREVVIETIEPDPDPVCDPELDPECFF